jgi:hypothetical protein
LARRNSEVTVSQAKAIIVEGIRAGKSIKDILKLADRSEATYKQYRAQDPTFKASCDVARASLAGISDAHREEVASDFASFRKKYLGMETFPHQLQWIDLLEGREPRNLHPAMTYQPGSKRHIMINVPPEHSKTISLTVDYVTYRICKNPSVRIIIISKTLEMAKQMVYAIKTRLTHPRYRDLQVDFAPADGFNGPNSIWQSAMVYLGSDARDSGEKDPTLLALGIGGQVYGARADLILCDDAITLGNAMQYESQIRWIQQEVLTRLGPGGRLLVVGTRVDSVDFYRELRNPERYPDGKSPWTYLAQPAVLEFHEELDKPIVGSRKLENGKWSNPDLEPDENGLYPRWDGKRLYARRGMIDPKTWSMVYQQSEVSESSVFNIRSIRACVNGNRTVGLMRKENPYHRKEGMDGLYVVCSMDPAMTGDTATMAYAVDVKTQRRYVLEANRMPNPTPQMIKNLIFAWTEKYDPACWVIEKNAFQLYLTRDEEIRAYLANKGIAMMEHYTGTNKVDPDFGVASLAPLFDEQMIELPSSHNSEGVKALIEQLVTWVPGVKGKDLKMDLPMSLWFAELRVRQVVEQHTMKSLSHRNSRYMPRYRQGQRDVVYLDEYLEAV